ncbi:NADH-quinone oxidoreductase subunit G, partial [Enterobacter hormaechei]|nr:NADH-quinone oxidoreductase subunit G [Enterobacter hormaechei]
AFTAQNDQWHIAPYFQLFGSEELSQRSEVMQARMSEPYVMINYKDAAHLKVKEGAVMALDCEGQQLRLTVRLSGNLAQGQVGLPLGMPGRPPVLAGKSVH